MNRKLRWRCRRGMKELDELLLGYLGRCYPQAPVVEQQSFEALLELPDPLLWAYLSGRELPDDPDLKTLIARIATHHT